MSHFMILATYSVRMQADTSPQGQFLPMITLYYILSIGYAFVALIWFIIAENWTTKQNVPKFLVTFSVFIKRILFWIFDEEPIWKRGKKVVPEKKIEETKASTINQDPPMTKTDLSSLPQEKKEDESKKAAVCFTCDFCENCQKVFLSNKKNKMI